MYILPLNKKAFTLIELIITIVIIALISAAVFVSVNPAKRIGEAKDSVRASDALAIEKAVQKSIADSASIPVEMAGFLGGVPYMIVTEGSATSGVANCDVLDESIARVDITTNFKDYIGEIPVDDDAMGDDTGYYIKRNHNSFYMSSCNSYQDDYSGFVSCGDNIIYNDESYPTLQIDSQCWFAKNLNIGTRVDGVIEQSDDGIIEKYCYSNNEANCDTYGGLYQWDETMDYVETESIRGICPAGWHIPSDSEWESLVTFLGGTSLAGGPLKETGTTHWNNPNVGATNSSGFTALGAGSRYTDGVSRYLHTDSRFWSSTLTSATNAYDRFLRVIGTTAFRSNLSKNYGFIIRCLQD